MKCTLPTFVLFLLALTTRGLGQTAPVITFISEARQVVPVGQSLTLQVAAISSSGMTYQWKRNGRAIPGATGRSYTITGALPARDNGWYQAWVANGSGTNASAVVFVNVAIESARLVIIAADRAISEQGNLGPVASIAAGRRHWLALRADGTVAAGGDNEYGQTEVPADLREVVGIAASRDSSLALKSDGRLVVWGSHSFLRRASDSPVSTVVPIPPDLSNVVRIVAGQSHAIALKSDGTVSCFGWNVDGQAEPGNLTGLIGVAAGYNTSFAWKEDGTVMAWGSDHFRVGADLATLGNPAHVADIVAGEDFAVALMTNGTLIGLGRGYSGVEAVPTVLPTIVGLAAGDWHVLALQANGVATIWGWLGPARAALPTDAQETYAVAANANGDGTGYSVLLHGPRAAAASSPPLILNSPQSQSLRRGSTAVLAVNASGPSSLAYQWAQNGTLLPGATEATLIIASFSAADSGNYACRVSNSAGTVTSEAATLSLSDASPIGRIANLSALAPVGTGEQSLQLGFTIRGANSTPFTTVLARAIGPALSTFGVSNPLPDPKLELWYNGTSISENDQWGGAASAVSFAARVGAFPLSNATSKDAALALPSLTAGSYALVVSGAAGTTGTALAELYDATPAERAPASAPEISNASVRAQIEAGGGGLLVGLIVGGETSRTFLIRAIGPSLKSFGVTGALADPQLRLTSGSTLLGSNDNWATSGRILADASAAVGAFLLASDSKDAALLVTLAPGAYVTHVNGVNGSGGVTLVEVYELP